MDHLQGCSDTQVLSCLLLQLVAVIKISARLIIAGFQFNLQVCHLAKLTLELAPTSGNFPKPSHSIGNVQAPWALSPAVLAPPCWALAVQVQGSLWRRTTSRPPAWGYLPLGPFAIGHWGTDNFSSPGASVPRLPSPGREPSTSQL